MASNLVLLVLFCFHNPKVIHSLRHDQPNYEYERLLLSSDYDKMIIREMIRMVDFHLCPKFEQAFELLGKRWTGLIIRVLLTGPKRFKDISDHIPSMSDRMLSERFKELEAAGIITRNVYPETPVRIEYELTDRGKGLESVMDELQIWAHKW
jgi:DNA-binding HxlR family transcriptional regulator